MGAAWVDVALEDMRIRGVTDYIASYAPNESRPLGRRANGSLSGQYIRASLVMGRFPNASAFNGTNPDFASELSYRSSANLADLASRSWAEILPWSHVYCGEPWGVSHAPGWVDNTRVLMWDWQVWVKSRQTGQWVRIVAVDDYDGFFMSPPFDVENPSGVPRDVRLESFGLRSVRLVYGNGAPYASAPYWAYHGFAGGVRSLNQPGIGIFGGNDVADVAVSMKTALTLHSTAVTDDRDFSRFVVAVGADYYPTPRVYDYPGVGTSRHKLVRAKYPQFQYVVMHTMTQAQLFAANGYPSAFASLSETYGDTGGGGGEPPPPSFIAPTRGRWFAKLTGGLNTWGAWQPSATVAPVWTSTALPGGTVGVQTSAQVFATGTPAPTFSKVSGPAWATVNSAGQVTYTPDSTTPASLVIRATNSAGTADRTFTITAAAAPVAVTITSAAPAAFDAGVTGTFQMIASGSGTITWSATGLPTWATFSTGGLLTVNSALAAQQRITVTASNGSTSDTRQYLVTVAALTPPTPPTNLTDNWTRVTRDTQDWTPL